MSTTPETPQSQDSAPEESFDELTGVYGWFRRHQLKLLYTAGLFTLVTFSITGPLQSFFSGLVDKDVERGSISVNGERQSLTSEDYSYGSLIARSMFRLPPGTILPIRTGDSGDSSMGQALAILRRAAILEGFEASMVEVDKAIAAHRERQSLESVAKLAQMSGFSSAQEYRNVVAEAMRIGMQQRLLAMAVDTSDAEVMRQVLRNRDKAAYRVAVWDAEKRQEEMLAASELTDDDLKKWLDEQNEGQKRRMGVFALPRVKLRIAAAQFGEGQFDPEQWKEGVLKDVDVQDDQLLAFYQLDPEAWTDDEGNVLPFEDDSVKERLLVRVQAEQVMNDLNTKLRTRLDEVAAPFVEKIAVAQTDLDNAKQAQLQAAKEKSVKAKALADAEAVLAKDPDDADLKAAAEALKLESEAAVAAEYSENLRFKQMEAGLEDAKSASSKARRDFDFVGEFAKLTEGKTGFLVQETAELMDSEQLADLDTIGLDVGLGKWPNASVATAIREAGVMGFGAVGTSKASIIFQAVAVDPLPQKPWEELKPLLQEAYFAKKATDEAIEKNNAIKDAMLRLAKEQMKEFVNETESSRQARIDEQVADWEAEVSAEVAKAQKMLQTPNLGPKRVNVWKRHLETKQGELAGKDARAKSIESIVDREIDNEIRAESLKHYGAVLDAAAGELGFEVVDVGPLPQDISNRPRFAEDFDKTTQFVFQTHNEMEAGDAIGPIYQQRVSRVLVCSKVEPLGPADVTRREFESTRKYIGLTKLNNMLESAFTENELHARYGFEKPVGDQVEQ